MIRKLMILFVMLWLGFHALVFCAPAEAAWNNEQLQVLELARIIGDEIDFPETMQAIAIQETMLGAFGNKVGDRNLPVGKRSYGVMQVKAPTARYVMHQFPHLKDEYFGDRPLRQVMDEEIIVLLMTDDEACVVIATHYLKHNLRLAKGNWSRAVMAYNQGWGRARKADNPRQFHYVQTILRRITKDVRPYREDLKRQEELRMARAEAEAEARESLRIHGALSAGLHDTWCTPRLHDAVVDLRALAVNTRRCWDSRQVNIITLQ